jgi:hypothetical protein
MVKDYVFIVSAYGEKYIERGKQLMYPRDWTL